MSVPTIVDTLDRLNDACFPNVPLALAADGTVQLRFRGQTRGSAFQPILSVVDGNVIGHAARLRADVPAPDGTPAWAAFAVTGPEPIVLELDRAFRTVHALNYFTIAKAAWRLFVRVHPRLVATVGTGHGRVFEGILGRLGVPTHAVVIELPRDIHADPALYRRALLSYRGLGYKVASDCMDPDDPVLRGRLEVAPDVIAVDHRWLPDSRTLHDVVAHIHALGAQALVARVETADQLALARAAGADFVQGFHLGRPARRPEVRGLPEALPARPARALAD